MFYSLINVKIINSCFDSSFFVLGFDISLCAVSHGVTKCTAGSFDPAGRGKPPSAEGSVKYRRDLGLRSWEKQRDEWGEEEGSGWKAEVIHFRDWTPPLLKASRHYPLTDPRRARQADVSPLRPAANAPGLRWRGYREIICERWLWADWPFHHQPKLFKK